MGQSNFSGQMKEVPSFSWYKVTMGQSQNLDKGWDRPEQPVKIQDGMWDMTVRDFHYGTKGDRAERMF